MYYVKENLNIEPIRLGAWNKPGFATVYSCFGFLGTRQYGAVEGETPVRMLVSLFMPKAGLEIYDGHAAVAVNAPCLCRSAPRNLHDLQPQMACPFFKECRRAFNRNTSHQSKLQ